MYFSSFCTDDLQNLLINHYEFALIENGGTICKELFIE